MNRQELKELLNKIKTSNEYPSSIDIDGMNYVIANISTDLFEDFEDIAYNMNDYIKNNYSKLYFITKCIIC